MIDAFVVEAQTERTSGLITSTLTDENGAAVTLASISSLTLTLYDQQTNAIINSRKAQNILNANNVTVGATDGLISWSVTVADTTPVQRSGSVNHVAIFSALFGSNKGKTWAIVIPIERLTLPS